MSLTAQREDLQNEKLAMQYYEAKEFDKANTYFDELFERHPDVWFLMYYNSLMAVNDYTKAEKICKKQLRNNKYKVEVYVYLGRIYKVNQDFKKEKEAYEKALKELMPVQPYIQNLSAAFMEARLYDYALQVYDKARKQSPEYPYFYERAEIFKQKNDLVAMINEYLDAIDFRESELESVQMHLQNSLGYDDLTGGINNPLLKQELQKRIQKQPDKVVFSEFLIFILKQQKEFDAAFVQCRALDKRLKEEGKRVFDLGLICETNKDWNCAKRCFDYVIEKGPDHVYYDRARIEKLNASYLELSETARPLQQNLLELEQNLKVACEKYRNTAYFSALLKNLVNLQAFYLDKTSDAITSLTDLLENVKLDALQRAEFKVLLGDVYLLDGQLWEASLLYSQVEKDFKYEVIGQEAKFKNAKLSFYAGDFAWAKTQADVLKGATSKLIANDALDLSLIITDAIGVDTNDAPLKLFAGAELLILRHKYNEAVQKLDSINLMFSTHTLGDDIAFKKAQVFTREEQYNDAVSMYQNILEYFPDDLYGDDAQFKLAELYEYYLKQPEKARQAYQDLMTRYPGSIFVVESRKRYRALRGDVQNN
ncbi:MAG TPA: tetratricopeptide repeat protein [Bacteroidia bacterium]|nr:tetratricopeptide repeat protein [Bacteroidia bacterium]